MEIIESNFPKIIERDVYENDERESSSDIIYDMRKKIYNDNVNIEQKAQKPVDAYSSFSHLQFEFRGAEKERKRAEFSLEKKYEQLANELTEFLKDLESVHHDSPYAVIEQDYTALEIAEEVKKLQSLLTTSYSSLPSSSLPKSTSEELKEKMGDILKLSNERENKKEGNEKVVYQLYRVPENQPPNNQFHFSELENRISHLEKILGSDQTGTVIGGMIELLEHRLSFLSNSHNLEKMLSQIKEITSLLLNNKLIARGKIAGENVSTVNKVEKLFEIMEQWEAYTVELPFIADQLQKLKTINDAAEETCSSVKEVKQQQGQISDNLKKNGLQLRKTEERTVEIVKQISNSIIELERKYLELECKVAKSLNAFS